MSDQLFDPGTKDGVALVPSFARHETFYPRHGWLKKGFDAAVRDPGVFVRPDATTRLGVGKNMVRAIRYWSTAYKVLEERPAPENPRVRYSYPTALATRLLGDDGWDPYLEDPGSVWLLHFQLLRSPCSAPSWFALFNRFNATVFTEESLVAHLQLFCESYPEWGDVATSSILKDARCLLRMYASFTSGRDLLEDSIASPFLDLELIQVLLGGAGKHFALNMGPKRTLPGNVLAFAAADFARQNSGARIMTVSRLAHAPGGPGRSFQMTESAIVELLDATGGSSSSGLRLTQAAGTKQLVLDATLENDPMSLLDAYYGARNGSQAAA